MAQQTINNGDTGLAVRTALNGMFGELYGALVIPLKLTGVNANTNQDIPDNTFLQDIFISATVGTPTLRIGTTPNGTDIMPDTAPGSFSQVSVQQYIATATTLYITISGGTVNIRFGVLNNFY